MNSVIKNLARTSTKTIVPTLDSKIDLLVSLWSYDILDEDQINDMTKIICGNLRMEGLNDQDQILPFAEFVSGDFDFEYDEDNEDAPYIYCTITSYLNAEYLSTTKYVRGIALSSTIKTTPENLKTLYKLWFNYNGYTNE